MLNFKPTGLNPELSCHEVIVLAIAALCFLKNKQRETLQDKVTSVYLIRTSLLEMRQM